MAEKLLKDVQVKSAPPGKLLNDGAGLFYRPSAKGSGRWVFRFTSTDPAYLAAQAAAGKKNKQREMGLGGYPSVSLSAARDNAQAARILVARGLDPIAEAKRVEEAELAAAAAEAKDKEMTFGRYADEIFLPFATKDLKNAAHLQQWQATFSTHALTLHSKPLSGITRNDVLAVLRPMWDEKNVTARRSRERIERLFSHAIQNGAFTGDNPASWKQFDHTLPSAKPKVNNHASVPHEQIAAFIKEVRAKQPVSMAALMLEWIALAACRTGEARFAVWSEIDPDYRVWEIPAERMKMKRGHAVPITERMREILAEVKRRQSKQALPDDLVFFGPKGNALSEMSALMLIRRMEDFKSYTTHGLRGTFKTWAHSETEFHRSIVEEQLAHQVGAVEGSYLRGPALERRRAMMEVWASYCDGAAAQKLPSNVVQLTATGKGNHG